MNQDNNDNVISHSIETSLGANERASLDRPGWTSEESTGMFWAHRHKHSIVRGRFALMRDFFLRKEQRR